MNNPLVYEPNTMRPMDAKLSQFSSVLNFFFFFTLLGCYNVLDVVYEVQSEASPQIIDRKERRKRHSNT
jgi:hypothetical protein